MDIEAGPFTSLRGTRKGAALIPLLMDHLGDPFSPAGETHKAEHAAIDCSIPFAGRGRTAYEPLG